MTQETPTWLDYSKPPPGAEPVSERALNSMSDAEFKAMQAEDWAYWKTEHDPPGMVVQEDAIFGWGFQTSRMRTWPTPGARPVREFHISDGKEAARAAAWAWHDRRLALVVDIDDQTGGHLDAAALLSKLLLWTDDECEEVEAYAALPFPRSVDMPQALQRVLLPEAPR